MKLASHAQVSAYAFTFPDESSNGTQIRMMLPLLDLLNHGNEGVAACRGACVGSWPCSTCLHARHHDTDMQLCWASAPWTGGMNGKHGVHCSREPACGSTPWCMSVMTSKTCCWCRGGQHRHHERRGRQFPSLCQETHQTGRGGVLSITQAVGYWEPTLGRMLMLFRGRGKI